MKLHGITGTGSGKLGSAVFSVTAGEQVVRQYQPVVTNPSTAKQVDNRAKMKLLSQLSAVMADVIAIPRIGTLTPRNSFVKDNYPIVTAENGAAVINLSQLSLTKGGMQIPEVVAERNADTSIDVALAMKADQLVSRVIYIMFYRNNQGELQLVDSAVVETAGEGGTFPWSFPYYQQDIIVYAYGIFDKNAKATATFGNYGVETGTQVASLIAGRKVSDTDFLISKTRGIVLVGETTAEFHSVSINNVSIAAQGNTPVPYDNSVTAIVETSQADGMYVRLVVDGVGSTPELIEVGYNALGVSGLAGGENIRVQIGTLNGSTFLPAKTFGGTAQIMPQVSAFSSVLFNGVSIAPSGSTQVAQALNSAINVTATGVTNKYLRTTINGTAQTPVAFNNGVAQDGILTPAIGDVITFQIGVMLNGTFMQDIAFGGQAVVAEVPATFTSVSVNGTAVPSTGSTQVTLQTPNTIVVGTQNATGKYLGILDGNNQVLSVHAISGNTTSVQQSYNDGDTIKFAIGTGSSTSSFVAQTNFGGSVVFAAAPVQHISNVIINGSPMNDNVQLQQGTYQMSGSTDLTGANIRDCVVMQGDTKPSIGTTSTSPHEVMTLHDGNFSGSISPRTGKKYWICVGWYDVDGEVTIIEAVYDYYYEGV